MKWFELFFWLLVFGFFTAAVFYVVGYVDSAVHGGIGAGAVSAGVGKRLNSTVNVYVSASGITSSPGSGVLSVSSGVCAHVSNATWWDVVCGPANATLRGSYNVTYWYGSSLQKDFAANMREALFWVALVLALVAFFLFEYYR